ncbi:hypothetical protein L0337_39290 [candidate division KSB1 bacterium]|nr:hypothetical protein [candidate division KSB1 bacterium]
MLELIDTKPDTTVQETEYKRLLGYPHDHELEGRARELADWARQWYAENGNPWVYAKKIDALEISNGTLGIDGTELSSKRLCDQLSDAQACAVMVVAVSAGKECEEKARQLWQEEKPDEYFFLEVYGSAVVEHLITTTGARFCAWAEQHGMAILPHYSPGYPGWNVSDQSRLLELLRRKSGGGLPGEIQVMDTGMLRPKKSLLAVFGITAQVDKVRRLAELIPCESCSMKSCQYRRVPYKDSRSQIENVRWLQARGYESANGKALNDSRLDHNAKYSISSRALRKWSQERLQLRVRDDRALDAYFRYEGTTCSNMGRRLEFDYHVKLSSATEGYRIAELSCRPAPDDTGHTYMCEYINDAEALMNAIKNENPLLDKPLDDVLSWKREYSPAGCYCDKSSREHKWGLVLEVIHYALVQHENQTSNCEKEEDKTLELQS